LHNAIPHNIVQVFTHVSVKYCSNLDAVAVNHQVSHNLEYLPNLEVHLHNLEVELPNLEVHLHNLEVELHNLEVEVLQVSNHQGEHLQMLDHQLKLVEMEELEQRGVEGHLPPLMQVTHSSLALETTSQAQAPTYCF
jgi:hypothetical protein